ncbi:MAG: CDP-glycerol glycerophosphotransferase family protein [Aliarcobacter sp.]|jgi:hypothetical protein|nr:CDP-glycerol glycerophosphotransferase family protein [Aliarcobacter sp.]
MKKKNIFLVCYGGGHINIIEPIVDELIKNENYNVKLLALTTAYIKVKNKYDKNILKSISEYLFLFDENIDTIFQNGLKIFEENYNKSIGLSKLEVLSYLGLSYSESIAKLGEDNAYEEYKKIGRQSFLPINTIKKILDYENIDLLITTNSPRFEKGSIFAAKELDIKSIQIIDLFGDDLMKQSATYTIVMNEMVKNKLIKKGFEKDSIFALGQPAIEKSIEKVNLIQKNKINIELAKNKKNLVYFSQVPANLTDNKNLTPNEMYKDINDFIFNIFEKLKDSYNILIKAHPSESKEFYEIYLDKYTYVNFLEGNYDTNSILSISDIILTPFSTVALQAICLNKLVFTFKPNFCSLYPIKEYKNKPFIYSNSYDELFKNIVDIRFIDNNLNQDNSFLQLNFKDKFNELLENYVFK